MNKKFIFILVSIISVSAMLFTSCKKEETVDWIKFNKIYFEPETIFLEAGETADVAVIALYTDASEVNVTDSVTIVCSDASSVEYANGKVTAKKDGIVTLSTYYNGSNAECNIVASTIERIEISVADVIKDLLLIPGQKIDGEAVEVTAYYTAGGYKLVDAQITSADPKVLSITKDDDGNITELQAVREESEQTWLTASYTTVNGTILKDELMAYTAELDSAVITLSSTKLDKGKPKYQRDTLLLGDQSDVLVTGYFSWDTFAQKDTVDARSFVDYFSFNEQIFYVDSTKYTIDAIGLTPTPNYNLVSAQVLGSHFASSRRIDVVKDTLYNDTPTYKVSTDAKYAYDDDIVYFKFTGEYASKDGKKTKTVDLTNTGNTDITSGYYITEPEITFCNPLLIKLCTGKIKMGEQVSTHATLGVDNEDSTGVVVIYKTSSKIDTVYSNQFRLYTHPQLAYSSYTQGMYGESIVLNWFANHLWEDEAEVVDNFGNRYTVANGGITPVTNVQKTGCKVYTLPLAPHMYNRTYTFTYGPEKRQCILAVGAAPQN